MWACKEGTQRTLGLLLWLGPLRTVFGKLKVIIVITTSKGSTTRNWTRPVQAPSNFLVGPWIGLKVRSPKIPGSGHLVDNENSNNDNDTGISQFTQTDHNRPNIVLIDKQNHWTQINIAVPCDFNVVDKQKEKLEKILWGVSFWDKADVPSVHLYITNSNWSIRDH